MQRVDAALSAARAAPQALWSQLSPENQQALSGAGAAITRTGKRLATIGALGAGAVGAYHLLNDGSASEQDARMRDYIASTQHQMHAPVPGMSVYASYDAYAAEKHAALEKLANPMPMPYVSNAQTAMASQFGSTLAQKLVSEPIDAMHRFLKRRIVDEPKHEAVFHTVISEDPMLQEAYAKDPTSLERSFAAMRKMSPDIAMLHGPVSSFLRHATMSGGTIDLAAVRQLAETQRFYQQGKGGPNQ